RPGPGRRGVLPDRWGGLDGAPCPGALAPGQSGNLAQRRLYVDLIAFPRGGLPRLAHGAPAAALAEAVLYENARLPSPPRQAYLTLLHQVGRHWPIVN